MNRGEPASVSVVATSIPIVRLTKWLIYDQFILNWCIRFSLIIHRVVECLPMISFDKLLCNNSNNREDKPLLLPLLPLLLLDCRTIRTAATLEMALLRMITTECICEMIMNSYIVCSIAHFRHFRHCAYFSEWSLRAIAHPLFPFILLSDFLYTLNIWSRYSSYRPEGIEIWSFPGIMQIGDLVQSWVKYTVPNPIV